MRTARYYVLLMFALAMLATVVAAEPVDVRLLIDVSGSMKQNDPANLRIPAVRLVAELMPAGAKAGIWTFSESVDPLIPPSVVDPQWKHKAVQLTSRIHSRGLFTNIEAALQAATADWGREPAANSERHVILLTDGVVDVSKNAAESAASRERLIGPGLDQLKKFGARVHTIALSENSDKALLQLLSESTEAWSEQVADAASLQRTFLHMFEQAAAPDAVPLNGNLFDVDGSINEMTLLVFRNESDPALELTKPNGEIVNAANVPANIKWRDETGYALVTVQGPAAGTWRINTEPDPDNRVLIVTDLKLAVTPFPTSVLSNESLDFRAHITEQGARLERRDFLELVNATALIKTSNVADPIEVRMPLSEDAPEFLTQETAAWPEGDYEVVVNVDGGTFRRERRSMIRIRGAPVTFASSVAEDGASVLVRARAATDLVDADSVAGFVVVENPDESVTARALPEFVDGAAQAAVPVVYNGSYAVTPHVVAVTASGRPLRIQGEKLVETIESGVPLPSAEAVEEAAVEPVAEAPIDWMQSGIVVLAANVLVGAVLALVWVFIGGRKRGPSKQVVVQ